MVGAPAHKTMGPGVDLVVGASGDAKGAAAPFLGLGPVLPAGFGVYRPLFLPAGIG